MRALTMVLTKTIEKVMWASVIVVKPRAPGQPTQSANMIKKISEEIPVITSGMINGAVTIDSTRQMPTNWLYRRGYVDATTNRFATDGVVPNGFDTAAMHAAFAAKKK